MISRKGNDNVYYLLIFCVYLVRHARLSGINVIYVL